MTLVGQIELIRRGSNAAVQEELTSRVALSRSRKDPMQVTYIGSEDNNSAQFRGKGCRNSRLET